MAPPRTYRLALIGFGAVGRGLAQILQEHSARLATEAQVVPVIVGVANSRTTRYDPQGLEPAQLLAADPALPTVAWDAAALVAEGEYDVLVEVSPTNLDHGEPATGLIRAAFARGKHVITANKGPLALHGAALRAAAQQAGVGFGFEATVMGGTPVLRLALETLTGCQITQVQGIINGTTNYILSRMADGDSYAAALTEAQRLGYAETDPTGDVEGHDAAGKAVILANMLFGAALRPADVDRSGITQISAQDVADAAAAGERWRLIGRVWRAGADVRASVKATRLPLSHPLASVSGATNALTITTDLLGDVTLIGPGAGGTATAFALIQDLVAIDRASH